MDSMIYHIVEGILTLVCAVLGLWVNALMEKFRRLELSHEQVITKLNELNVTVAQDTVSLPFYREDMDKVFTKLDKIMELLHTKADRRGHGESL